MPSGPESKTLDKSGCAISVGAGEEIWRKILLRCRWAVAVAGGRSPLPELSIQRRGLKGRCMDNSLFSILLILNYH